MVDALRLSTVLTQLLSIRECNDLHYQSDPRHTSKKDRGLDSYDYWIKHLGQLNMTAGDKIIATCDNIIVFVED
jgi:hypothetical protein